MTDENCSSPMHSSIRSRRPVCRRPSPKPGCRRGIRCAPRSSASTTRRSSPSRCVSSARPARSSEWRVPDVLIDPGLGSRRDHAARRGGDLAHGPAGRRPDRRGAGRARSGDPRDRTASRRDLHARPRARGRAAPRLRLAMLLEGLVIAVAGRALGAGAAVAVTIATGGDERDVGAGRPRRPGGHRRPPLLLAAAVPRPARVDGSPTAGWRWVGELVVVGLAAASVFLLVRGGVVDSGDGPDPLLAAAPPAGRGRRNVRRAADLSPADEGRAAVVAERSRRGRARGHGARDATHRPWASRPRSR